MKHVMVLGSAGRHEQWLEELFNQLPSRPRFSSSDYLSDDCDGLLVVDNGSLDGFSAIRSALALRDQRPGLPIAVVTTLDGKWSESECLARSQRRPGEGSPTRFNIREHELRDFLGHNPPTIEVTLDSEAVLFEYNG